MSGARQAILPFFIPMQGCANRCVYCDQHSISGQAAAPSPADVTAAALAYRGSRPAQLAFYGGSFTALPRQVQGEYLRAAQPALQRGLIDSLRVSTRPDAVDQEALALLAAGGVTTVELGIQSFDAAVLAQSGRAYSPGEAEQACVLVHEAGLTLGIQLMTGLPGDNRGISLFSTQKSCALRPAFMRIYPTLVLRGTPLAADYARGLYRPQELPEAATLAGDMLALALEAGIKVIRLGLNPSASLEEALLAGPYHPAFGQMARNALKLCQAHILLDEADHPRLLRYPAAERSLLYGQKNMGWQELRGIYAQLDSETATDLPAGALQAVFDDERILTLPEAEFLRHYTALLRREISIDNVHVF